jgi:hypothetical protein
VKHTNINLNIGNIGSPCAASPTQQTPEPCTPTEPVGQTPGAAPNAGPGAAQSAHVSANLAVFKARGSQVLAVNGKAPRVTNNVLAVNDNAWPVGSKVLVAKKAQLSSLASADSNLPLPAGGIDADIEV